MARTPRRRRPRRKRLVVNATQPNDIPYSKCRIEWIDIVSDSGWATDKEFNRMKLATPVNEGWIYSKDKNHVKVFASYDKDDETKEITFGDRTMIPIACIKKITKLISCFNCLIQAVMVAKKILGGVPSGVWSFFKVPKVKKYFSVK